MDGPQNIAISKTGLLYCAATIGSFLHVPACTFVCTSADKYGCDPITANFREKTRPSSRSDQSYRACYLLVHRVEVQLTGTHRRAWTCRYCRAGLVPATCE